MYYLPSWRWRDWGSESSQNSFVEKWQKWPSNSRVFGSTVGRYILFLLCQPCLKNRISDIYSQLVHLLILISLSLCIPFCPLPFSFLSLLCCNLHMTPLQSKLPTSKYGFETLLSRETLTRRCWACGQRGAHPPSECHVHHTLILEDCERAILSHWRRVFGYTRLSQQLLSKDPLLFQYRSTLPMYKAPKTAGISPQRSSPSPRQFFLNMYLWCFPHCESELNDRRIIKIQNTSWFHYPSPQNNPPLTILKF